MGVLRSVDVIDGDPVKIFRLYRDSDRGDDHGLEYLAVAAPLGQGPVRLKVVYSTGDVYPTRGSALVAQTGRTSAYAKARAYQVFDEGGQILISYEVAFYANGSGAHLYTPRGVPDPRDPDPRGEEAEADLPFYDPQDWYPAIQNVFFIDSERKFIDLVLSDAGGNAIGWSFGDVYDAAAASFADDPVRYDLIGWIENTYAAAGIPPQAPVQRGGVYSLQLSSRIYDWHGEPFVDDQGNFNARLPMVPLPMVKASVIPVPGVFTLGPTDSGVVIGGASLLLDPDGKWYFDISIAPDAPVGRQLLRFSVAGRMVGIVLLITSAGDTGSRHG